MTKNTLIPINTVALIPICTKICVNPTTMSLRFWILMSDIGNLCQTSAGDLCQTSAIISMSPTGSQSKGCAGPAGDREVGTEAQE